MQLQSKTLIAVQFKPLIQNEGVKRLHDEYNKYYDSCEAANRIPLIYREWLKTKNK